MKLLTSISGSDSNNNYNEKVWSKSVSCLINIYVYCFMKAMEIYKTTLFQILKRYIVIQLVLLKGCFVNYVLNIFLIHETKAVVQALLIYKFTVTKT